MDSSHKPINYAGRFEYLKAIREHLPEVLGSLGRDVFPVYQECRQRNKRSPALQNLGNLAKALRGAGASEFHEVDQALDQWAVLHGVKDDWIRDAAVQTMWAWALYGPSKHWTWFPAGLDTPRFQPSLGVWVPYFYRSWAEFRKLTDASYRRQLAEYRSRVTTLWGAVQTGLSEHALWAVWWQQGKSPEGIRRRHQKITGKSVSLTNIQVQVHAFADAVGLTLRTQKAGPRRRKI
jgi:hypothetical protein